MNTEFLKQKQQYDDQEYQSYHSYPLTQVYDLIAQQELDLKLKLYNYDEPTSYSHHENVKNRRGGGKVQKQRANQKLRNDGRGKSG